MSKRKPRRTPPRVASEPTVKKKNSSFGRSFAAMIFLIVGILSAFYCIYLALTPKKGDTINAYIIESLPRLITVEWILYSVIAMGFIYCAFKWIFSLDKKLYDYIVLGVVFFAINGLFFLSFDKDIGSFGDNAQYIVHSKSLIEKGGPYDLYFTSETYKARAPIGFPLMLAPITSIYGMNVLLMKKLVFLLGSLSLIFFFLSFRKTSGRYLAGLVTMLIGTYPLIIYNTSYVMTEVPFVFSVSLAIFCALKLKESQGRKQVVLWLIAATFTAFLAYMTRAVGASVIAGVSAWLFFQVPWIKVFRKQEKLFNLPAYKFLIVSGSLVMLFFLMQLQTSAAVKKNAAAKQVVEKMVEQDVEDGEAGDAEKSKAPEKKTSQLAQFLNSDFKGRFNTNFKKTNTLWAQQIFNRDLSRWYLSLGKAAKVKNMNSGLRIFNIILFISLFAGLIRRDLIAFVFLFLVLITLAGTGTPVLIVYSRYFIPFVPFIIYLMAHLLLDISRFIQRRKPMPVLDGFAALGTTAFLFMILYHNFSGGAFNTQRQNAGDQYTIAFDNYVKSAQWVKENIKDEDAIVASRKPRLFYVFSEHQGVFTITYSNMVHSAELEEERINTWTKKDVDYVILDAFSTASRKVILPIVQNNPDKFKLVKSVGEKYPSHVLEFVK